MVRMPAAPPPRGNAIGRVLLPLRLFLGATFTFAGLQKLADPKFLDAKNPTSLQGQLAAVRTGSPLEPILGLVAHHAVLFGTLIALTELAVGIAMLLGLFTRLAAVTGALLALSFFLTISWHTRPYYYGSDIVFLFAYTPFIAVGAGGVLSLDAVLFPHGIPDPRVGPSPERRRLLATLAALGGGVLALGGLDAVIGRAARGSGTGTATAPPSAAPSAPPSAAATAGPPATASGPVVAKLADLPVGGAVQFTDSQGAPAYAVRPASNDVKGFSAICTHAGCTVGYVDSDKRFHCPCHGAVYDGASGQVLAGPAPLPLQPIKLVVADGEVHLQA
jgi:thiosulfate dehydrogenase [quinone] large subunit